MPGSLKSLMMMSNCSSLMAFLGGFGHPHGAAFVGKGNFKRIADQLIVVDQQCFDLFEFGEGIHFFLRIRIGMKMFCG
jgi:hypothetical protein